MPNWALAALKWTGAILVLVLVVMYAGPRAMEEIRQAVVVDTGNDDEEEAEEEPEESEPDQTRSDTLTAVFDLSERNGTIEQVTTEQVVLGDGQGQQVLFAFEPVPADTACLTEVYLEVLLHESEPTELLLRPAQMIEVTTLTAGAPLPPDAVIEGVEPVRAVSDGSPGWLRWDIPDIYTLAAREAPSDLVVLSVAPPPPGEDGVEARTVLGSVEGGNEQAARLTWTAVVGCGGDTADPEVQDEALEEEEDPVEA